MPRRVLLPGIICSAHHVWRGHPVRCWVAAGQHQVFWRPVLPKQHRVWNHMPRWVIMRAGRGVSICLPGRHVLSGRLRGSHSLPKAVLLPGKLQRPFALPTGIHLPRTVRRAVSVRKQHLQRGGAVPAMPRKLIHAGPGGGGYLSMPLRSRLRILRPVHALPSGVLQGHIQQFQLHPVPDGSTRGSHRMPPGTRELDQLDGRDCHLHSLGVCLGRHRRCVCVFMVPSIRYVRRRLNPGVRGPAADEQKSTEIPFNARSTRCHIKERARGVYDVVRYANSIILARVCGTAYRMSHPTHM